MQDNQREQERRDKLASEKVRELAEVVNSVAKSPLHTYRMNGRKIGIENNYPTLGLNNAS